MRHPSTMQKKDLVLCILCVQEKKKRDNNNIKRATKQKTNECNIARPERNNSEWKGLAVNCNDQIKSKKRFEEWKTMYKAQTPRVNKDQDNRHKLS